MKRNKWKAEDLNKMLQLYRDGVDVETLAANYSVTTGAIRQQASYYKVYRTPEHLSEVRRAAWKGNAE